jgi:hypothetical protein
LRVNFAESYAREKLSILGLHGSDDTLIFFIYLAMGGLELKDLVLKYFALW